MAAWTVTTPVPGWTGDVGGVHFSDGVAVLDDAANGPALAYCMAAGYGVELAGEEATEDETQKPVRRTRSSKETNA